MGRSVKEILDQILESEGGYQSDPKDDGNYYKGENLGTNYGITPKAYEAYYGKAPTRDDMYTLSEDQARSIYRKDYVAPVLKMNPPAAAIPQLVDMFVNHGPRTAAKIVQRTVGAQDDGVWGAKTTKAVKEHPGDFVNDLAREREKFYVDLQTRNPAKYGHFKGWVPRAREYRTDLDSVVPVVPEVEPNPYDGF
jgi:lysozyme family protein